jgi:hypothetical protein
MIIKDEHKCCLEQLYLIAILPEIERHEDERDVRSE